MNNKEKLIYLAGIMDGEGHFSSVISANGRGEKHRYALIAISQKDKRLLDWIKQNFGGNVSKQNWKTFTGFQWQIRGKKAILLAELVQPYLIVKDKQVFNCITARCELCSIISSITP